ncbi:hypothetical protein PTE30175_05159 [Pandoraea terrae]|uniref:Uncharacterized protein n=1 Tax=Pandoraea terrae TaxID=1537710 RepID=A0A5E4ZA94_9BURK|nr:hypothetical protein PTE30175_05159 [Pandoraea terrae]
MPLQTSRNAGVVLSAADKVISFTSDSAVRNSYRLATRPRFSSSVTRRRESDNQQVVSYCFLACSIGR